MQLTVYASVLVGLSITGALDALAQQVPPVETGTRKVSSSLVNGELEMRNLSNGRVIIARQRIEPMRGWGNLTTNVTLQEQPTGADLIITATNNGSAPRKSGEIGVGVINLGERIEFLNSTEVTEWASKRASTMVGWAGYYPAELYSPVMVMRNQNMAVGVSIQYPVMDYKHDVRLHIDSPGNYMAEGEAGKGWTVRFRTSNMENSRKEQDMFSGEIQPGQTRTYVVSIRVTDRPDEWITTLLPYRNYFRATYGPVQYVRKTTPVLGVTVADPENISTSNPLGYREDLRPDLNGFARTKNLLLRPQGWPATMVWMISGLYNENREQNFPYLVGSQFARSPQMQTATDPVNGLPAVPAAGRELGIWWGRSLLMSNTWNSADMIKFDPDNPNHLERALREIDGIAATGATIVGLDTFQPDHTPLWKSMPWLQTMRNRHPQLTFVTEPAQCDILHTVAATYVTGFALFPPSNVTNERQLYKIDGPNHLMDFMNPGHETWGSMSYHQHRRFLGGMPSLERMTNDMRQFAEWGYRPIFFDINTMPANVSAAPSWEDSLPQAIVASDPIIQAIKRGRRPNEAGNPGGPGGEQNAGGDSGGSSGQASAPRSTRGLREMRGAAVRRGPSFVVRGSSSQGNGEASGSSQVSRQSAPSQRNRPRR